MADNSTNEPLPGQQEIPGMPPKSGLTDSAKGLYTKAKNAFNLGKEGRVAADFGADKVTELNRLKDGLKVAEEAKIDTAGINVLREEISKTTEEVSKVKGEAFKNSFASGLERTAASIGGNFGKDVGKGMKFARGAGAVVGLGAMISGGKDILAPAKDENGERKNGFAKTALKLAGGAAVIWASLVAGGKNRAMGI